MATGTIGNTPAYNPQITQTQAGQTAPVDEAKTKAGVAGSGGVVPSPEANGTGAGAAYVATFSALFASSTLAPSRRGDMEVVLAEVSAALKETRDKVEGERINTEQEKIRASQAEQQEKLAERTEKIEDSLAQQRKSRIGGIFSRIFQGLALALTAAIAGMMFASGVGAALGAALIAGVVIQAYQLADGVTADVRGLSLTGGMAQRHANAMGKSPEEVEAYVQKVENGVNYALLGISLALAAVTIGASMYGIGTTAAAKVASTADDVAAGATQATSTGTRTSMTAADIAKTLVDDIAEEAAQASRAMNGLGTTSSKMMNTMAGAEAAVTIGEAGTAATVSVFSSNAANLRANAQELKGQADAVAASIASLEDLIDEALKLLMQSQDATAAMLDAASSAL